jgi:hypothetical protein
MVITLVPSRRGQRSMMGLIGKNIVLSIFVDLENVLPG